MKSLQPFKKSILFATISVAVLWLFFGIEQYYGISLSQYGVKPRSLKGLRGILFSPFLHGSIEHITNNSISLWVLLFYFHLLFRKLLFNVVLFSWIATGLWVWISARDSYHIGASGLLYSLFGFLFLMGFLKRQKRLMGLSFLVIMSYGGMVWGIFPIEEGVSWESHFWGLTAGVLAAIYYRKDVANEPKKNYRWDEVGEDQFVEEMEHQFGEDYWMGAQQERMDSTVPENNNRQPRPPVIVYHFKKKEN
jgi:membrane associated rhomboid family serine protease